MSEVCRAQDETLSFFARDLPTNYSALTYARYKKRQRYRKFRSGVEGPQKIMLLGVSPGYAERDALVLNWGYRASF